MSESVVPATATAVARPKVALGDLFLTFLIIGATSFGGGVVAYLRNAMVAKKQWFTDVEFLELTSISNTLPGLNATNMAILAGDRLCGCGGELQCPLGAGNLVVELDDGALARGIIGLLGLAQLLLVG